MDRRRNDRVHQRDGGAVAARPGLFTSHHGGNKHPTPARLKRLPSSDSGSRAPRRRTFNWPRPTVRLGGTRTQKQMHSTASIPRIPQASMRCQAACSMFTLHQPSKDHRVRRNRCIQPRLCSAGTGRWRLEWPRPKARDAAGSRPLGAHAETDAFRALSVGVPVRGSPEHRPPPGQPPPYSKRHRSAYVPSTGRRNGCI